MSAPALITWSPGATAVRTAIRSGPPPSASGSPPTSSVRSTITTASAPSGITAPVDISAQVPGSTVTSGAAPAWTARRGRGRPDRPRRRRRCRGRGPRTRPSRRGRTPARRWRRRSAPRGRGRGRPLGGLSPAPARSRSSIASRAASGVARSRNSLRSLIGSPPTAPRRRSRPRRAPRGSGTTTQPSASATLDRMPEPLARVGVAAGGPSRLRPRRRLRRFPPPTPARTFACRARSVPFG